MLRFGAVDASSGDVASLHLMVKGKYKEQVEFSVESIDPEAALAVEIRDPVDIKSTDADGNETLVTRRFPLTISIKKDSPVLRRLGSKQGDVGRIVLNTNHPEIEQFDIKVQFSTR